MVRQEVYFGSAWDLINGFLLMDCRRVPLQTGLYRLLNVGRAVAEKVFPYREDNIHHLLIVTVESPLLQKCSMRPEEFPDNPFDPVSSCYPFELTMNTDAESVDSFVVRGENETELIPLNSLSNFVRQAVILRSGK